MPDYDNSIVTTFVTAKICPNGCIDLARKALKKPACHLSLHGLQQLQRELNKKIKEMTSKVK